MRTSTMGQTQRVLVASRRFANSFVNLPYLLASAGLEVDVVIGPGNYLKHSRWIRQCFITADADQSFSEMVRLRLLTGDYCLLVIVDEPALNAIYANPASADIADYLPLPWNGAVAQTIGRKDLFHEWCDAHQIPTPKTFKVSTWEATEQACEQLGWPCVLKGVNGFGGQAVFIVRNIQEARQHRQKLSRDQGWLVQEHVVGMVGSAPFFAARGELRAWMGVTKMICLRDGKGPRVMGDVMDCPQLEATCERVAKAGQMHGLTAFDFIVRDSGEIVLIDPHFGRCATIYHFGALCGVDFGLAVKEWLEGSTRMQRPEQSAIRGVKYPEAIQYAFQAGPARLFQQAPLLSKQVKYFWGPPRDWRLLLIMSISTFVSSARVALGGWLARRRQLKTGHQPTR